MFGKYGPIHDITIKKFEVDQKAQVQRGYGFVHFPASEEGVNAALKCAEALKDQIVDNIHYKCDISHKLLRQLCTHNPSHMENIGHSHGRYHNHNHHNNNYQQQQHHAYKGAKSQAREYPQYHSQSSELSELTAPSIDLSSMSLESMGSGSQQYSAMMHAQFSHLPAPPVLTHPQGPPSGPMRYSMPGLLTQPPPQFYHHHQSPSLPFPHPESLYMGAYQQQAMFQSMPGNIIALPGDYQYFPSASTTPASHYVRNINPSGKASYSSSTTTAMMGDIKMSLSSSSSNPATPMTSPVAKQQTQQQQPPASAPQQQQSPSVYTASGIQRQGNSNSIDIKSTGSTVEFTRSPSQDTKCAGEHSPIMTTQAAPKNPKSSVQLHHHAIQNHHQYQHQNQYPYPQSQSPQQYLSNSNNLATMSPSQLPLSPLYSQHGPHPNTHHVPPPQGNLNDHIPRNPIYSGAGQAMPVSASSPAQARFAPSPVPTIPVHSTAGHPSPTLTTMAYPVPASMNHPPLQVLLQHQQQQQLQPPFCTVPLPPHLSVHPTILPPNNESVYSPILPTVAASGSPPMMLQGQLMYHQQHPVPALPLPIHPPQGSQQQLCPSLQPMLPPPTLPLPITGAPNGIMLTAHNNNSNPGTVLPPPPMPGFAPIVLPSGFAPHPPPSLTYPPPLPHMQLPLQTQVQQQLPPSHQYQHHHHQQQQQLHQPSFTNQSSRHQHPHSR